MKDYYQLLGVTSDADLQEIREAYRRLAQKLHPDKSGATQSTQAFKNLNRVYAILKDPERRAAYDSSDKHFRPLNWRDFSSCE